MGNAKQGRITHVTLVLDASWSIGGLERTVVKVADNLIKQLAEMGKSMPGEEIRVTAYEFADTVSCIFYDKSARDLPSVKDGYSLHGNTALIDATMLSINDQREIPQKYGDHAFLTYVLTDGQQNGGRERRPDVLKDMLDTLRDNETVACLVPDEFGIMAAKRQGFPAGNVTKWDATTVRGVEQAGEVVAQTTRTFIENRATTGVRSTTGLFSMSTATVNDATVKSVLKPLSTDDYKLIRVTKPASDYENGEYWWIKDFTESSGYAYVTGHTGYYEFVYVKGKKPSEVIKPTKKIIIVERSTGLAYGGAEARQLLGLPTDKTVRIKAERNPEYDIYFASSANNRHLIVDTHLLIWDPTPLKTKK